MSTWLQVYGTDGPNDYRANCKSAREAAILVAIIGDGATIRSGKTVLWTEGKEGAKHEGPCLVEGARGYVDHIVGAVNMRIFQATGADHPDAKGT